MGLNGVYIAVVTPFTNDKVDVKSFTANLERWNKTDVAGYLVLGSTGEYVFLNSEEKVRLVAAARERMAPDKKLIIGVGSESVSETSNLGYKAAELGADYALAVNPCYYKPIISQDVLRRFYLTIADRLPIPVLIYNIPQFTGINIRVELILELTQHENIVGLKDSSGNAAQMFALTRNKVNYSVLTGHLISMVSALLVGADGAILAFANTVTQDCCDVYQLFKENQVQQAMSKLEKIIQLANSSVGKYGIPGIKKLMEVMGYQPGAPRLPLSPVTENQAKEIEQAYQQYLNAK